MTEKNLSLSSLVLPNRLWNTLVRFSLSLLFSRMSCPSSLILLLCVRCFWPCTIFLDIFLTHTSACLSLLCWGAQTWTQLSRAEQRQMITSLDLVETLLLSQSRKICSFLLQRHIAGSEPISSPQGLSSPSEVPSSWWVPSVYWCMAGFLHRGRDWLFPLLNHVKSMLAHLSSLLKSPWMATQPTGASTPPHCSVSSANSVLLSRSLLKTQNSPESRINPWITSLMTGLQTGLFASQPLSSSVSSPHYYPFI